MTHARDHAWSCCKSGDGGGQVEILKDKNSKGRNSFVWGFNLWNQTVAADQLQQQVMKGYFSDLIFMKKKLKNSMGVNT